MTPGLWRSGRPAIESEPWPARYARFRMSLEAFSPRTRTWFTQAFEAPPDILITTPESLYLMLTSQAQELFRGVRWCIVDEIHAVAATKRGAHLALSLERLTAAAGGEVQRIGLSATQRPLEEVARFMV